MEQLIITDLNKLKITKVKNWAIYFNYDNEKYLLHGSGECGEYTYTLFKRVHIFNDKYELKAIFSDRSTDDYVANEFIKESKKNTLVYDQIDKKYFIDKLVEWGFSTSKIIKLNKSFLEECKNASKIFKSENYDYRINLEKLKQRYENKIRDIESDNIMLGEYDTGINDGLTQGLETAIQDIEDILDGLEM